MWLQKKGDLGVAKSQGSEADLIYDVHVSEFNTSNIECPRCGHLLDITGKIKFYLEVEKLRVPVHFIVEMKFTY